jgi:hypothetical protein
MLRSKAATIEGCEASPVKRNPGAETAFRLSA